MAKTVEEIMNRELFTVRDDESAGDVLHYLMSLGIGGAPVVDTDRKPIGFISLRDVLGGNPRDHVLQRMTVPVDTLPVSAEIPYAATRLCETGRHHLVCVDDDGRAIGFVGSLDVLRGVIGLPISHPPTFPHYDPDTGLPWSDEARLDLEGVESAAPDGAGLFVLVHARPGRENRVVWSEASANVRRRLTNFLADPSQLPGQLRDVAERGQLWFRAALAPSSKALESATADSKSA